MIRTSKEDERRKLAEKFLKEEQERRKEILRKVLEDHGWAVEHEDLDDWLDLIDDFNKRVQ